MTSDAVMAQTPTAVATTSQAPTQDSDCQVRNATQGVGP